MTEPVSIGVQAGSALVALLADGLAEHVDHIEVIPDRFWTDWGVGHDPRYEEDTASVELAELLAEIVPLWGHGIGLSIASADFDEEHARTLAAWSRRFEFPVVSEHLSAFRILGGERVDHHAGLALPIPWDHEVLALVAERVDHVQQLLGGRVLLENGVVHTPVPDCEMEEGEFLHALVERTGCGLLLDLHNLYVNCVNNGGEPIETVATFPLQAVEEVHVAGGRWMFGAYLDAHSEHVPDTVFTLLAHAAPRCPSLRGVTFEVHETVAPDMGIEGVAAVLARIREATCPTPATSTR